MTGREALRKPNNIGFEMNNRPITDKNINFNQAKIIETNEQKRTKSCMNSINIILKQHNCTMVPVFEIIGNQLKSKVVIMPNKRE
jgi:hypothetical protein